MRRNPPEQRGSKPAPVRRLEASHAPPAGAHMHSPPAGRAPASSGHSLDPSTRTQMEGRLGHDFGRVRIHDDATAAAKADTLGARAYTLRHDVVFGEGEYRPATAEGQGLIAHELTHVVQQEQGRASDVQLRPPDMDFDDPLEQEANEAEFGGRRQRGGTLSYREALETIAPPPRPPKKAEEVDPNFALFGGTLAAYKVDKKGKIQGWNMDAIAAAVAKELMGSKSAKIWVNGYYSNLDEIEFDPNKPIDDAKGALVQWIGKSKISDIEDRITTYYGRTTEVQPDAAGTVEIEVKHETVLSTGSGPEPSPKPGPGEPATKSKGKDAEEESPFETEVKYGIKIKDGEILHNINLEFKVTVVEPRKLKLGGSRITASFGQLDLGASLEASATKTFKVKEFELTGGAKLTLVELKADRPISLIPKGTTLEVSADVKADPKTGQLSPGIEGELKVKIVKGLSAVVTLDKESAAFRLGYTF
jgi:hypothetical protein